MSSYNKSHKLKFEDELPISTNVDFSHIGGLNRHICTLREMVIFPLIYKNVYEKFNIKPPRGILFHGPPGTGKTLVAKALATECAKNTQLRVSFFSRKGSDILDKWVGESERKLRTLFEKAVNARPSVIFFDEIDALAPTRCSRQDQVHTSVVATLLALMDGLDTAPSGGIVIIGATNRINAIDPALRRTGRFDRELYFPLPCKRSRFDILQIITQYWQERPTFKFLKHLADHTTGYCGSDLQALCSDAVLSCLKRYYPTILQNNGNPTNNSNTKSKKLLVNFKKLHVEEIDFINAQNNITPMSRKCRLVHYRLSHIIEPLLIRQLDEIVNLLKSTWTHFWNADYQYKHDDGKRYIGRIIILGNTEQGHTKHIAPALLHHLEHLPTHILDVQEIHENTGNRPLEEIFIEKFRLARQCCPSILYTPSIDLLWDIIDSSTKAVFLSLLYELDPEMPLLIITTSALQVPIELQEYFSKHCSLIYRMSNPNVNEREEFFAPLFLEKSLAKPPIPASSVLNETNVRFNKNQSRCSRRLRGLEATVMSGTTPDEKMNLQQRYRKRSIQSNNYPEVGVKRLKTEKIESNEIEDELKQYHNTVKIHSSPAVIKLEHKEDSKLKDQEQKQKQYHQQLNNDNNNIDITISRPKLLYLYQHAVKDLTINTSCVSLELLYDKLNSCIQTYQYIWNRHSMLEKIEKILIKHEEVVKHYKVDNQQHFEGDLNSI